MKKPKRHQFHGFLACKIMELKAKLGEMDNLLKYGPIDVVFSFCSYILESVKIIDAHVHLGSWPNIETSKANLLYGMDAYGIASGILSHADCSTFPGDAGAFATPISAVEGLRQCIEFAREHPGRFHLAIWIKPLVEPRPSEELLSLIQVRLSQFVRLYTFFSRPSSRPFFLCRRRRQYLQGAKQFFCRRIDFRILPFPLQQYLLPS